MQSYTDPQASLDLAETLGVLRRRWMTVVVAVAVTVSAAVGYAQYREGQVTTRYQSTVQMAMNPTRGVTFGSLEQFVIVINEGEIADEAEGRLEQPGAVSVSARADVDTGVIRIRAVSENRQLAESAAAVYAETVLEARAESDRQAFERQLGAQQDSVDESLEALNDAEFLLAGDPDNAVLQAEREAAINGYRSALDALRAIQQEGLPEPELRVLAAADSRMVPIGGFTGLGLPTQLALGLALGALLGIGLAYLRDALDRRIGSASAATQAFNVPVIAEVPHGGKAFAKGESLAPPGSMVTEAYRRLRTIVQLEAETRPSKDGAFVVLVVSASPEEGKSTTVAHLARSLAEVGSSVLMVSADFRRPKLHRLVGMPAHGGIAALAERDGSPIDPTELIQKTPMPNVSLAAAGRGSSDPTQLLKATAQLIKLARDYYDYIVVDSSPVLSANDALDLARSADAVVAVSRYKHTARTAAERTAESLSQANAPLLGVVLTAVRGGEGYGYYYGYYSPVEEEPRRRRREPSELLE